MEPSSELESSECWCLLIVSEVTVFTILRSHHITSCLTFITGAEMLGCTTVNEAVTTGQAFGVEFIITMVLVLVVFGAAADANNAPNVKVRHLKASDWLDVIMKASDWLMTLMIVSNWSGLCSPGHWTVHHHVSPVRHPPNRLQHEPRQVPGLGPGLRPLLGQSLALLAGPHLRRGGCSSHLPAPPQGQTITQIRFEQHQSVHKLLLNPYVVG